jgi:hypothetical protein
VKKLHPILAETLGLFAQAGVFLAGLVLSIIVGMVLAAHLDGQGGLLFSTFVSGAGLLTFAALSQSLRDWLTQRGLES